MNDCMGIREVRVHGMGQDEAICIVGNDESNVYKHPAAHECDLDKTCLGFVEEVSKGLGRSGKFLHSRLGR